MNHLKTFESLHQTLNIIKLRDFCNEYLVDLVDLGFDITINKRKDFSKGNTDLWVIQLRNINDYVANTFNFFSWDDIKDKFIPFYYMLKDNYIIKINNYNTDNQTTVYALRHKVNGSSVWLKEIDILADNFNKKFKTKKEIICLEIKIYGKK